MAVEIKAAGALTHINVRKEGPEEDKVTAIDLKFTASVPADLVSDLILPKELIEDGSMRPLDAFWNSKGEPRFLDLTALGFHRQMLSMTVDVEGVELTGCKVSKFSFHARDKSLADLNFSVSTTTFPSNTIAILADKLQEVLDLHIWAPQGDMFDESADKEEAAH